MFFLFDPWDTQEVELQKVVMIFKFKFLIISYETLILIKK